MKKILMFVFGPFLSFSAIAYFPVFLYLTFFGFGYLVNASIIVSSKDHVVFQFIVVGFFSLIFPLLIMLCGFVLFTKARTWKSKGWIIYFCWLPLLFIIAFVFIAAFAGLSQAVVEGGEGTVNERYRMYLLMAGKAVVFGHIFLVPWVYISLQLLKKLPFWKEGTKNCEISGTRT